MEKKKRDVIVSRFETFTDDFRFDDNKSTGMLTVNSKDKTISFAHDSGDSPTLYVVLMIMSINKQWIHIVDSFEGPPDLNHYFLLSRWISFDASDFYLCREEAGGVPIIEKCLIKCGDGGGIDSCTLSPFEYLLLIEYDLRFGFTTPKSRLKELRHDYDFRYLK